MPQGLIEKSLRSGKIKVNKKKIKSSHKIKSNDKIDFYDFKFEERILSATNAEEVTLLIKENIL